MRYTCSGPFKRPMEKRPLAGGVNSEVSGRSVSNNEKEYKRYRS